jgi:hypothetical protein
VILTDFVKYGQGITAVFLRWIMMKCEVVLTIHAVESRCST